MKKKIAKQSAIVGSLLYRNVPAFALPIIRTLLNNIINRQFKLNVPTCLNSKVLKVEVTDLMLTEYFCFNDHHLQIVSPTKSNDIHFKGELSAFIELLLQREDADTLFFNRRLLLLGNLPLGLEFKRLIETIDFNEQPKPLKWALHQLV